MPAAIHAIIAMACCLGATATAAESAFFGWARNGSSDFPNADPPVDFDGASGKRVRWRTVLPNSGNSSPILARPVDGSAARIVCLSEPVDDYMPVLSCHDAATGEELWRRALDPVACMPEAERAEVREVANAAWQRLRDGKQLAVELGLFIAEHREAWGDQAKRGRRVKGIPAGLEDGFAPFLERGENLGMEYASWSRQTGAGSSGEVIVTEWRNEPWRWSRGAKQIREWGLIWNIWEKTTGVWDGVAWPTPVTDGRHIFVVTGHGHYSCWNLDGKPVWQRRFNGADPADLDEAGKARIAHLDKKHRWGGRNNPGAYRSCPLLWRDEANERTLLITAFSSMYIRAQDAANGEVIWRLPMPGGYGHSIGIPTIFDLDGTACMIMADSTQGQRAENANEIIRLRDGKVVGLLPGATCTKGGMAGAAPVLRADGQTIVVNLAPPTDGGKKYVPTGWRLTMAGDGTVTPERLWSGQPTRFFSMNRMTWRGTDVFGGAARVDARTGTAVHERMRKHGLKGGSYDGHHLLAGPYYVQCHFYAGKYSFWDIETGELAGVGSVPISPDDGLPLTQRYRQAQRPTWRWASAAVPIAWTNRLYLRTMDHLYCFEKGR